MQTGDFAKIEKDLKQIADMLLLNGTLTECPGLVHGKMGIAIFFFHYAKYTGNNLFADYAMDVISEMLNQLHINSPADYEKGIAGIGIGIDYLIQNNFLDADDDICEDFDQRMARAVMADPWPDFSLYSGLTGYGRYWITRLRYRVLVVQARECLLHIAKQIAEKLVDIPLVEHSDVFCFLNDLCQLEGFEVYRGLLAQFKEQTVIDLTRLGISNVGNITRMVQQGRYFNCTHQDIINTALTQIPDLEMEKPPESTGLLTGYAGEGMLRLSALNKINKSWMLLL